MMTIGSFYFILRNNLVKVEVYFKEMVSERIITAPSYTVSKELTGPVTWGVTGIKM